MVNFNRIFFISTFIIFFIHLLYISLTSALKAEMDFNDQSPADYTLIVNDIPKEKNIGKELKDDFLDDSAVNIKKC